MEERFEIDELIQLQSWGRKTAALCRKHGYVDGATAAEAVENAAKAELAEIAKRNGNG